MVAKTESQACEHFCDQPYLLDVDLDVLLQVVAVQVEDEVVDKVKPVADDDEWQLVGEFGFLSTTHTSRGTLHNQSNASLQASKHPLILMQRGKSATAVTAV